MTTLTDTPAWRALAAHKSEIERTGMRELFARDPERFQRMKLELPSMLHYF